MSIDQPNQHAEHSIQRKVQLWYRFKNWNCTKTDYPRGARNTCVGWADSRDILSVNSRVNSRSVKFNVFGVGGWIQHAYHKLSRQHVECFNLVTRVSGEKIRNPGNEVGVSTRISRSVTQRPQLEKQNFLWWSRSILSWNYSCIFHKTKTFFQKLASKRVLSLQTF